MCAWGRDSPVAAALQDGRREGALEGRLDGGPERRERLRAELAGPLVRPREVACDGEVEAVLRRVGRRGVGLDADERGGPVEGVSKEGDGLLVLGRARVSRGRGEEAHDGLGGVGARAGGWEGLEEGLDGGGGRARSREAPVDGGRGHVHGGEDEDVEQARLAPGGMHGGGEVVEGERGVGRGEAKEGVGDVELILRDGLGELSPEVVGGEVAVEEREGAR